MQNRITQPSSGSVLKRILEQWPYLLIAISVGGLAYRSCTHTFDEMTRNDVDVNGRC